MSKFEIRHYHTLHICQVCGVKFEAKSPRSKYCDPCKVAVAELNKANYCARRRESKARKKWGRCE